MSEKHYREKLSEFVNHELSNDSRQEIAEHLLVCADCRAEHDEIKLGAALAANLERADAPENLWNKIENALDAGEEKRVFVFPIFTFFRSRAFAAAVGVFLIFGLIAIIYFRSNQTESPEIAVKVQPINIENAEIPQAISTPDQAPTNENPNSENSDTVDSSIEAAAPDSNNNFPKIVPRVPNENRVKQNESPSWNVETLAGSPKIGNSFESGKLAVGEFLETDANSRARVQVADIGQVEIQPNSRIQLVRTLSTEHRLSLEKGELHAKILAPPRLFIVDTPSAVAVDLGCEYTLEVDKDGNSKLHVTSGYVALENDARDVIVPAGAIAFTRKNKGIGTPFSVDASETFQNALMRFDFENGGSGALQTILKESGFYDTISLWHLLPRTSKTDREDVFDVLSKFVKPPAGTTRAGILKLDKKMLDRWWTEIENVWFE